MAAWPARLERVPRVRIGRFPAFAVCAGTGLAAGTVLAAAITVHRSLPVWVLLAVAASGLAAAYALAAATKVVLGRELLIAYHHQLVVGATAIGVLVALDRPLLANLDAVAVGLVLALGCGRVGCLLAGCCYGRPARFGVSYGHVHGSDEFPIALVGARLLPVQAFEAIWLGVVAIVGTALAWVATPGAALTWSILSYGAGRFLLEFLRGDPRISAFGLSQAQWTAVLVAVALTAVEAAGELPLRVWLPASAVALALALAAAASALRARRSGPTLFGPRHAHELAEALCRLEPSGGDRVSVASTSLGIQVSSGFAHDDLIAHYAISGRQQPLDERSARRLADLLVALRHPVCRSELRGGGHGVYHVLVKPRAPFVSPVASHTKASPAP